MLWMNRKEKIKSRSDKTGRDRREGKEMRHSPSVQVGRLVQVHQEVLVHPARRRRKITFCYVRDYCLVLHFQLAIDSEKVARGLIVHEKGYTKNNGRKKYTLQTQCCLKRSGFLKKSFA